MLATLAANAENFPRGPHPDDLRILILYFSGSRKTMLACGLIQTRKVFQVNQEIFSGWGNGRKIRDMGARRPCAGRDVPRRGKDGIGPAASARGPVAEDEGQPGGADDEHAEGRGRSGKCPKTSQPSSVAWTIWMYSSGARREAGFVEGADEQEMPAPPYSPSERISAAWPGVGVSSRRRAGTAT